MLRLASYDIVFQEVPGEVTLALNLSGCPHRCPGCHSPHLQEETGEDLSDGLLDGLLLRYGTAVTCVCFMGGDADPEEVSRLAALVRRSSAGRLKTAWYSGRAGLPQPETLLRFDYLKTGPYVEALGGLSSPATNQRFYQIEEGRAVDMTAVFR